MSNHKRTVVSAVTGVSLILGGSAATALALDNPEPEAKAGKDITVAGKNAAEGTQIIENQVLGEFAYTQTEITPNSVIASTFRNATNALCNATEDFVVGNPLEWKLKVSGDVENTFEANVGDLAEESAVKKVMTCSCGGNPADGAAIITADVKGIPVSHLLTKAQASKEVNTATFIASDGTEIAIPVGYLVGRHAVISYEINDEDLSASVGGNNQLWMTRTPANYFLRDIVEVRFTAETDVPANPGEGAEHPNSPNVGILDAE